MTNFHTSITWRQLKTGIDRARIPHGAYRVYCYLLTSCADYSTGAIPDKFQPTVGKIADNCGRMSVRQVYRILHDLEKNGWITITRAGRGNQYVLGTGREYKLESSEVMTDAERARNYRLRKKQKWAEQVTFQRDARGSNVTADVTCSAQPSRQDVTCIGDRCRDEPAGHRPVTTERQREEDRYEDRSEDIVVPMKKTISSLAQTCLGCGRYGITVFTDENGLCRYCAIGACDNRSRASA